MAGRPTRYKKDFAEQARKLCLLGATDSQLGDFFGVSEQTINTWKSKHPEFLESIKEGKEKADSQIAESLFNRALGYSHESEEIKVVNGAVVRVPIIKQYPPDTTAAIFWLKNRQKENWRDKTEVESKSEVTIVSQVISDIDGTTKGLPGKKNG
jgi:hypothetical protein